MSARNPWSQINVATAPKGRPLLLRMSHATDEIPLVGFYDTLNLRWMPSHAGAAAGAIYPKYWAALPVFERP